MAQEDTVLVATVAKPGQRFRIAKAQFDKANEQAEEAGNESPFIVQEEGYEGGKSYDQLSPAEQERVDEDESLASGEA